jgi:hypothetical protein
VEVGMMTRRTRQSGGGGEMLGARRDAGCGEEERTGYWVRRGRRRKRLGKRLRRKKELVGQRGSVEVQEVGDRSEESLVHPYRDVHGVGKTIGGLRDGVSLEAGTRSVGGRHCDENGVVLQVRMEDLPAAGPFTRIDGKRV